MNNRRRKKEWQTIAEAWKKSGKFYKKINTYK